MSSVEVRNLAKRLGGKSVLSAVSFKAGAGDIVSFIGPSGCGKTTLLRCILGELIPEEGQVRFDGKDVTYDPVERRNVGIVYQDYALFPHMTVADNIGYGLKVRGSGSEAIRNRVAELIGLVKLEGKEGEMPRRLSGGQQQRVALARALAVEPRVLLLDEAFTALDATTRTELVHQVRTIIQRLKLTTLLVTHDQEEAFLFARHVIVLNEGRVVLNGTPEVVIKHPDPFLKEFVKMILFKKETVQKGDNGHRFVQVGKARIPIAIAGISAGDEVHVMIKKGPEKESVEVWPLDKA